jgi:hypothetical protein
MSRHSGIMPIGYSIEIKRKKLVAKLRQERDAELAHANSKDCKRIEKEIKAEARRQTKGSSLKDHLDKIFPWF